jgi:catechol 2,3-dioxygenase-like lactoylglutathione lyase family enzyme
MVPIYGLHHIGLTVPNMDEAVRFFETMFGAVTVLRVDGVNVDDERVFASHALPRQLERSCFLRSRNSVRIAVKPAIAAPCAAIA